MWMKVAIVIVIVIALCAWAYAYLGGFASIVVEQEVAWPYIMVYKQYQWDYAKISDTFKEIETTLELNNIDMEAMIWIYYDDPKTVDVEKLRANVGALITQENEEKASTLEWLTVSSLPLQDVAVIRFPFRSQFSILLALNKVYPKMDEYLITNWFKVEVPRTEIYDEKNKVIKFITPLVQQQQK